VRKLLIPIALIIGMALLLIAVAGNNAAADDGKGKGEEPKPTSAAEPTKGPEPTKAPEPTKEPEPPKDSDKDGVINEEDNCVHTPNPDQANSDGDDYGDACDKDDDGDGAPDEEEKEYGSNPHDPDSDKDGCMDGEELNNEPNHGGHRDPTNHWDFYDIDGNGTIDLFIDIFTVAEAYGPADGPDYVLDFDRSSPPDASEQPDPSKREPWDMGPPNGAIDLFTDVFGSAKQFGHHCEPVPKK
jgi:hypothetical protein